MGTIQSIYCCIKDKNKNILNEYIDGDTDTDNDNDTDEKDKLIVEQINSFDTIIE